MISYVLRTLQYYYPLYHTPYSVVNEAVARVLGGELYQHPILSCFPVPQSLPSSFSPLNKLPAFCIDDLVDLSAALVASKSPKEPFGLCLTPTNNTLPYSVLLVLNHPRSFGVTCLSS